MPTDFRQTASALHNDERNSRRSLVLFGALGFMLAAVGLWMALARVPLFAVSELARLQARDAVHPVDTLVSGRVTAVALPIGGVVHKGDVLLTLDATDVGLRLDEAHASERGLAAQIAALDLEIAAREDAI